MTYYICYNLAIGILRKHYRAERYPVTQSAVESHRAPPGHAERHPVMLSAAKHLGAPRDRSFTTLRMILGKHDTGRQLRLMRIGETSNTGRGRNHSAFLMKMAQKE